MLSALLPVLAVLTLLSGCGSVSAAVGGRRGQQEANILAERLVHPSAAGTFRWGNYSSCPRWIEEYLDWHSITRGVPGAKYLINSCPSKQSCQHGLGDRLRGLLPSVQLAKAHQRVLLIDWSSPAPLESFFLPAHLNWSLTQDLTLDMINAKTLDPYAVNWTHADAGYESADAQVWVIDTNRTPLRDQPMPKGVRAFRVVSSDSHCILRSLFKPSPALTRATDDVQRKLLGSLDQPFVAVHLRMGHLEGEHKYIDRRWNHFEGLLAAYKCATERDALLHGIPGLQPQDDAAAAGQGQQPAPAVVSPARARRRKALKSARKELIRRLRGSSEPGPDDRGSIDGPDRDSIDGPPDSLARAAAPQHHRPRILILTDHEQLRSFVSEGMLQGATGPGYTAHHLSNSELLSRSVRVEEEDTARVDATMTIFVDFLLLTRAYCLVWARSGFPTMAMAYAWHPCTAQVEACIDTTFPQRS